MTEGEAIKEWLAQLRLIINALLVTSTNKTQAGIIHEEAKNLVNMTLGAMVKLEARAKEQAT